MFCCFLQINRQLWVIIVVIQLLTLHAFTQMILPGFPPPMMMMPQIQMGSMLTATTDITTTTTEATAGMTGMAFAVPVPLPMPLPVQIAIPAQTPPDFCQRKPRPSECPPCPPCQCGPSCTPAFFSYCSPCHKKCRCRNRADAPDPQPLNPPMPVQGPAFAMPFPGPFPLPVPQPPPMMMAPYPHFQRRKRPSRPKVLDYSDSRCGSESSDSSSSSERCTAKNCHESGRKERKRRQRLRRRNLKADDFSHGEFVKPTLRYLSKNGDIKIQEELSSAEADQLLEGNEEYQLLSGHGPDRTTFRGSIIEDTVSYGGKKTKHVFIGSGNAGGGTILKEAGKKQLMFKTPKNKQIANVSLTFDLV